MPERGPAFVHDLGLALRVEILRHLAHDAHQLALPGLQQGRVLLDEVQQVLLRLGRKTGGRTGTFDLFATHRQGTPQLIDLLLGIDFARAALGRLLRQRAPAGTAVAIDPMVGQRMAGIEEGFDRLQAMALLTFGNEIARIDQVVDDGRGIGPHAEQVVALEKAVVPVGRVRDHQGLHGRGVLLHQIADAGVGIDHDFIGQAHVAAPVFFLGGDELLAIAPVPVVDRHADRGIGVHHLLGGDDFQLVRIGVQAKALRGLAYRVVVALYQLEGPVALRRQRFTGARWCRMRLAQNLMWPPVAGAWDVVQAFQPAPLQDGAQAVVHDGAPSFLNRSRNTG